MFVLFSGYCESFVESGRHCLWLNDTNSSCDMCNFTVKEGTLDCSNRTLQFVTLNVSEQIVGLNVSHNLLDTAPLILDCPNLVWIDLSYNTQWKFVTNDTFRNMKSSSLKIINMNNCGILKVVPVPIECFFPNLMIFLIANNLLAHFNVSYLQKLEKFMLLDIRGNNIIQKEPFCKLMQRNVSVLVDLSPNRGVSCEQINNFCQTYSLAYRLTFCQESAQGTYPQASSHCVDCTKVMTTSGTVTTSTTSTVTTCSSTFAAENFTIVPAMTKGTEELPFSTIIGTEQPNITFVIISASCAGFVALVFLISYQIRKCWKRKRRQNQYNRWLAVYTPPDQCVCTFQKRVSFSGEIVINQSGENLTKKKLNSDELKEGCSRQFDISLLIRTQSLPPVEREDKIEKSGRVLSWI